MKEKYDFYLNGKDVIFLLVFWGIFIIVFTFLAFSNANLKNDLELINEENLKKDEVINNLQIEIAEDNTYIEWLQERIKILDKEELKVE